MRITENFFKMASLIDYFYDKDKPEAKTLVTSGAAQGVAPENIRETMAADFRDLTRWVSQVFEELSAKAQKEALQRYEVIEDRVDRHYRASNWAGFQGALTEAYNLFRELRPTDHRSLRQDGHWIYRAWSRVLDAEVWFVCCQKEVDKLLGNGIKRGAIYTKAELKELIFLSKPAPEDLKKIHLVKSYFDGVITRFH